MIESISVAAANTMGATSVLVVVFFMVMRGTLATPAHQKVLLDRITFLENLAVNQATAVKMTAENAKTIEPLGAVVEHTFDAIKQKAEGSS